MAIKEQQNRIIFGLGLAHSASGQARILEIGPGDGHIATMADTARLDYTAVEGSSVVADRLRARGIDVHDGYVPPLPASLQGPYTCCFLLHVLEHMPSPHSAAQLMAEVYNALVPGGAFVIACPDYVRWGSDFYDCDYTHSYPLTRRRLSQLVTDHGFEVVKHTIYCGPVFGYLGLPLAWLARVLYPRVIDGLIGHAMPGDVMNRGKLTFLPNLLTVARRPF